MESLKLTPHMKEEMEFMYYKEKAFVAEQEAKARRSVENRKEYMEEWRKEKKEHVKNYNKKHYLKKKEEKKQEQLKAAAQAIAPMMVMSEPQPEETNTIISEETNTEDEDDAYFTNEAFEKRKERALVKEPKTLEDIAYNRRWLENELKGFLEYQEKKDKEEEEKEMSEIEVDEDGNIVWSDED